MADWREEISRYLLDLIGHQRECKNQGYCVRCRRAVTAYEAVWKMRFESKPFDVAIKSKKKGKPK